VGDEGNNLRVIEIAKIVQDAVPGCKIEFLEKNLALDKEGLIRDRKVKGGVDTRTYRVSFEKIKTVFPGFKCAWPVKRGVEEMAGLLEKLFFGKDKLKQRDFYRLQKIESLHENRFLSDDLRWLKDRPEIPKTPRL
ncbi:MAG: hypothetical protein AAB920_01090, partial [Patescibacteria group bacterium]